MPKPSFVVLVLGLLWILVRMYGTEPQKELHMGVWAHHRPFNRCLRNRNSQVCQHVMAHGLASRCIVTPTARRLNPCLGSSFFRVTSVSETRVGNAAGPGGGWGWVGSSCGRVGKGELGTNHGPVENFSVCVMRWVPQFTSTLTP